MFEIAAQQYHLNHDTLLYYYCLNDMAFELAEQGKKDSCNLIVNQLLNLNIQDSILKAYCCFSKAEGYLQCKQYDSVIVCAHQSKQYYPDFPSATLQLAQAYSQMRVKDSAVFYASQVVEKSTEPFDLNNALYILTHDDETKDKNEALETSADRSDVQKLLEIRQGHLSQAVQLLDQDLHRKPDWRWLYAILVTLVLGGLGIVSYHSKKRKQHKLLSQQIDDMKEMQSDAEERFEHTVEQHNQYQKNLKAQIEQSCALISQSEKFPNNLLWKDYDKMCEIVNVNYGMLASKLQKEYALSQKEIRLCVLVLHGVQSGKQMSELLFYAESGIRNLKNRTAKKLGTNSINLRDYLIQIAAGEYPNTEI
jgi:DNA-binding CsgD family transcriptional regulator